MTEKLRHVVIGAGAAVFQMHRPALRRDDVNLVAVCDTKQAKAQHLLEEFRCGFYSDYRRMLAEVNPDVAVIMTPHPQHARQAIDCLEAGCHVLVEKPMAIEVAEADEMIASASRNSKILAVSFQQRFRSEVDAARKLLRSGRLGQIQHVDVAVSWPRTAVYYKTGHWRATWRGEGGGVLLNQAIHELDLLCYLLGMPDYVFAWTRTTLHQIETEDTVQAMLHWPKGAMGSLHISTAQGQRPYRLEIVGTRGTLNVQQGGLTFNRYDEDVASFLATSTDPFSAVPSQSTSVPLGKGTGDHLAVYRNFHNAVRHGTQVRSSGKQGRMSLELANAMIYSSHTGKEVALPLDRKQYGELLKKLKQG